MKAFNTIFFLLLKLTLFGQVNDADAFFNGSYNKALIREHKIDRVTVQTYINGDKTSLSLFDFDYYGFLTKETSFDSSGKKCSEVIFTYNKQGDQTERKKHRLYFAQDLHRNL
jgi:hypothetical protein